MKLLMKAKNIINQAKADNIKLDFDIDIDNHKPNSYKDIIYNKNQLSYIKDEVKNLEKKYNDLKSQKVLENLDFYRKSMKQVGNFNYLIMEVTGMDVDILKVVADNLANEYDNSFIFFANIKNKNSINFIARSNSNVSAGFIIKEASTTASGNGGGSNTFASGGGKDINKLKEIYNYVEKEVLNEK